MLQIYKASAGSGKTFTLTGEFLALLFENRYAYRHTLAVTFTNKASAEMKQRILQALHSLAYSDSSEYLQLILDKTGKSKDWIKPQAELILTDILQNYSFLFIETIDTFFQRIIRIFTKEFGLNSYFNLELNITDVLTEVVNTVVFKSSENQALFEIIQDFINHKIDEGKGRNISPDIIKASYSLFQEEFVKFAPEFISANLPEYYKNLQKIIKDFEDSIQSKAKQIIDVITSYNLDYTDFNGGKNGFMSRIVKLSQDPKSDFLTATQTEKALDANLWSSKSSPKKQIIDGCAQSNAFTLLEELIALFSSKKYSSYCTAVILYKHKYTTQLLFEVQKAIDTHLKEKNSFLLSNTNALIQNLISESDAPFIYEKTGCYIKNIMIDEFQDTSIMQWKNFKPLIENVLSENGYALVVGDVKQSIYRFRNGNWNLLHSVVENEFSENTNVFSLQKNWRSKKNIIEFNNTLFSNIVFELKQLFIDHLDKYNCSDFSSYSQIFEAAFSDSAQELTAKNSLDEGYITIHNFDSDAETYKNDIKEFIVKSVMQCVEQGYKLEDITFLASQKKEISLIVSLLDEAKVEHAEHAHLFNIVSNEALLVSNSRAVSFIIAYLQHLLFPNSEIYTLQILKNYCEIKNLPINFCELEFNQVCTKNIRIHASLFETTEEIIREYQLDLYTKESLYLFTFQDIIHSYSRKKGGSITAFLEWWKKESATLFISNTQTNGAMQAMTIHKSKGLEFKIVIMPFLNWKFVSRYHQCIIKTKNTEFSQVPVFSLPYPGNLYNSVFKEQYVEETMNIYLENLNKLYVALTRAQDALFLGLTIKNDSNTMGLLLQNTLDSVLSKLTIPVQIHDANTEIGTLSKKNDNIQKTIQSKNSHYKTFVKNNPLLPTSNLTKSTTHSNRIEGIIMHSIFERIKTFTDIIKAIDWAYTQQIITALQKEELIKYIPLKINSLQIKHWFEDNQKVLTEQSLLLPKNPEKRPDRIIVNNSEVCVIDYKFGDEKSTSHIKQVKEYMHILQNMNFTKVQGYIWYYSLDEVVECL